VWFYIYWCKYWREAPIFRKIYSVILNFSSKNCYFLTEKSYLGRGLDTLRMTLVGWGGRSKLTAYDMQLLGGEGRPTAYDLESVGGEGSHTLSHTLLHVWYQQITWLVNDFKFFTQSIMINLNYKYYIYIYIYICICMS